ncbi:MAG: gas vesicle protein GvpG [Actinobacteria bacterium]|nr:gas vesicle protein GvpG [Actinomycetota bacterium]MBU4403773.1 gas vesicle protein GvpG [Actinomycetota bacterium]MCG2819300.1 gas vesicle protein GvpG [Actinomycetes bacterium]
MKMFIDRMFEIMVASGQIPAGSLAAEMPPEPANTPPYNVGPFVEPASQVPPYACSQMAPPASQVPPMTIARKIGALPTWATPGPINALPRDIGLLKFVFKVVGVVVTAPFAPVRVGLSTAREIAYIAETARDQAEEEGDYRAAAKARLVDLAMRHEMEEITDEEYEREVKRTEDELRDMEKS